MLMSTNCIRKVFPNDIGSAQVIKNLVTEGKIKVKKRLKIASNKHTLDNFRGSKKITSFYESDDIESAIEMTLSSPEKYRISTETKDGYKRLLYVIEKLKEEEAEV